MRTPFRGAVGRAFPPAGSRALAHRALALALALAPAVVPMPVRAQQGTAVQDTRILPGDLIRLQVWREPDWNGDFLVDQFGVAALPLGGDLAVEGMTQRELKEKLRQAFAREIREPLLQVLVLKRIRVLGEVRSPGVFTLDPTSSVADALALAGGRSSQGRSDRVLLRRAGQVITANVLVDTRLAELAIQTGDELSVPERPWISRNAPTVIGTSAGLLGILAAVLIR
ncbi:MAG: hypothetical protein FIA95_05960 [Gemmatimonadetes bacterium]|nr:hypothetical protein [Gemmatimonadota bacterium]